MRYIVLFIALIMTLSAKAQTMQTAKQDAEELMNGSIGFAEQLLHDYGEFFPFGSAMTPSGEIIRIAGYDGNESSPSQQIIDLLNDGFRNAASSGQYKATALFYDVRVSLPDTELKSDAIAVALDHRDNYSVVVFFPYATNGVQISFGEVFAQIGENDIFND